ncbi:MAG: hypothetical protein II547_09975, partial [Treponema sp.]|nr:hypothetical protein [Treponema sp.]
TEGNIKRAELNNAVSYTVSCYEGYYNSLNAITAANAEPVQQLASGNITSSQLSSVDGSPSRFTFDVPLGICPRTADNYTVTVRVKPYNGMAYGNEMTFLVYGDNKAPVLTVSNADLIAKRISGSSPYMTTESEGDVTKHFYEIRGKISDVGGSGVKNIQVRFNGGEWKNADSVPNVTTEAGWSHKLEIAESKGGNTIELKTIDEAGNESTPTAYSNVIIDFKPPTVDLDRVNGADASELAQYYNTDLTLRFIADDEIGTQNLNITPYKNGVFESLSTSGTGTNTGIQRTVELKNDGNWRLVVSATDLAGQKSQEKVFETCLDKTEPTVNTLTVDGSASNDYYSSSMLKVNVAYTEALSGLSSVSYRIKKPDNITYTEWTEESASGTGGTFSITPSGFSAESGGVNTLYVKLKDKAGNESDVKNLTVKVDQGAPTVDVSYYGTNATQPVDIPGTVYYKAGDTSKRYLMGKVSDDGGIGSVKLKNGNEEITAVVMYTTTAALASASNFAHVEWKTYDQITNKYSITGWMAEFSTPSADCTVSVTATDLAGLDSSVRNVMTFKKDEVAPTLLDINLSDNGNISEDDISSEIYTLRGKWSDDKSGTETLKWRLNDTGDWNDVGASTAPKTTTQASWYIEIPKSSLTAGNGRKINLKATDAAGNETVKDIAGISVDYQAPTLGITKVNGTQISDVAGIYKKDSSPLTLEMKSHDDQGVEVIEVVSAKRNGESVTSGYTFSANSGNTTNETATLSINRNGTQDGKWDFEIRSKDMAGRTSPTVKVSTTVDGTDPTIDLDGLKVENEAWTADSWYRNNILRVSASAEDTEGGSGLESV